MGFPTPRWAVRRPSILCAALILLVSTTLTTVTVTAQGCPARCQSCVNGVANCQNSSLPTPPKFYPPNTKVVNLQMNNIRILGSRTFRQGQTAEVLKLGRNRVTTIRHDAFRSFPLLMSLDLTGNKITRIYPRALSQMVRLRTLTLNRNRIRRLTNIFQGTPNLHQLNLASNRITTIEENSLAPLTRMHYLDLRDNRINSIHNSAFKELRSLRYLFLNNNPIAQPLDLQFSSTILQLVDMSKCQLPVVPQTLPSSVTDLRLGNNNIMQINHTDFENIEDMQMLALNENELHFLADGTFSHLTQLKEIWLRGNNLVYVPRDIPPNVEKLYMDSNRLQEIEAGLFPMNSQLSFISAQNNQLRRIVPNTFTGLGNLQTINLQGNQLQTLETDTFAFLPSLHTLLLSNNPLQRMEANVFQSLPNLRHLHFSYQTDETVDIVGNFLPAMPQLESLEVMASPGMGQAVADMVETAVERDFIIQPSLKRLDLTYNNLRWLSPRFRVLFPNVQFVLLEGNPFHCTETLAWLKDWMTSSDNITFFNSEAPKCETPYSLSGRDIVSLTNRDWRMGEVDSARNRQGPY